MLPLRLGRAICITSTSTTKTISFSSFVFAISAFKPIEISYSNTVCNKSAAEAWICLVSFYGREWWSERLHCHMLHGILGISFTGSNLMKPEKPSNNKILIILKTYVYYLRHRLINQKQNVKTGV